MPCIVCSRIHTNALVCSATVFICININNDLLSKSLAFRTTMMATESYAEERWNLCWVMRFCNHIVYERWQTWTNAHTHTECIFLFLCSLVARCVCTKAVISFAGAIIWECLWILFENTNDELLFISFNHWNVVSQWMRQFQQYLTIE